MSRHHAALEHGIITGEILSNIEKRDSNDKVGSFVQLPTFGDIQSKSHHSYWVCSQEFGALSSITFKSFYLFMNSNVLHFSNLQNMTSMFPQHVLSPPLSTFITFKPLTEDRVEAKLIRLHQSSLSGGVGLAAKLDASLILG